MMDNARLRFLTQLMLKTHFELREGFGDLLTREPAYASVGIGSTHCAMVSRGVDGMLLKINDNGYEYQLDLQWPKEAGAPVLVNVSLKSPKQPKSTLLELPLLQALLRGEAKLPKEFQALHERAVSHLQKLLPPGLLEHVGAWLAPTPSAQHATSEAAPADTPAASPVTALSTDVAATDIAATDIAATESPATTAAPDATAQEFVVYCIPRENLPDLKFKGKPVAHVESAMLRGRRQLYDVFVTPAGKLVCVKAGQSYWVGERTKIEVAVACTQQEVIAFFGFSALAKLLYTQLALDSAEFID